MDSRNVQQFSYTNFSVKILTFKNIQQITLLKTFGQ